jgi:DnaJ-domain-containing protein 1
MLPYQKRYYSFRGKRTAIPAEFWNRRPTPLYSYGLLQQLILAEMLRQANQNYRQSQQPPFVPEPKQSPFDPYAVLGITKAATKEEISAAYRKKAQENHPDKVTHLGPEFQNLADQKMKVINEAYNVIRENLK